MDPDPTNQSIDKIATDDDVVYQDLMLGESAKKSFLPPITATFASNTTSTGANDLSLSTTQLSSYYETQTALVETVDTGAIFELPQDTSAQLESSVPWVNESIALSETDPDLDIAEVLKFAYAEFGSADAEMPLPGQQATSVSVISHTATAAPPGPAPRERELSTTGSEEESAISYFVGQELPRKPKSIREKGKQKMHQNPDISDPRVVRAVKAKSYRDRKKQEAAGERQTLEMRVKDLEMENSSLRRQLEEKETLSEESHMKLVDSISCAVKVAGGGPVIVTDRLAYKKGAKLTKKMIREIAQDASIAKPGKRARIIFDIGDEVMNTLLPF